jgi:hypothetical protein
MSLLVGKANECRRTLEVVTLLGLVRESATSVKDVASCLQHLILTKGAAGVLVAEIMETVLTNGGTVKSSPTPLSKELGVFPNTSPNSLLSTARVPCSTSIP